MFTLSSTDINIPHISPKEKITRDTAASCDDNGHVFVYDPPPNAINKEPTGKFFILFLSRLTFIFSVILPRHTDRIHQWLSTCEAKEANLSSQRPTSPQTQIKMRCIAKPIRHPSLSPPPILSPPINTQVEPGRFRSCLKIQLEPNELTNHRSRASSSTSKHHQQQQKTISDEDLSITHEEYYQQTTLSPHFQRDHQAVFL